MSRTWKAAGTARWTSKIGLIPLEERTIPHLQTPKLVKTMGVHAQFAILATAQANPVFIAPPERRGLIVCLGGDLVDYSELTPYFPVEKDGQLNYLQVSRRTPPLWLLKQLANMPTAHLAREWQIQGPTHSFNQLQTPLQQGWLTAQMIFEAEEADEILVAALDVHLKPDTTTSLAVALLLSEAPATDSPVDLQELYNRVPNRSDPL